MEDGTGRMEEVMILHTHSSLPSEKHSCLHHLMTSSAASEHKPALESSGARSESTPPVISCDITSLTPGLSGFELPGLLRGLNAKPLQTSCLYYPISYLAQCLILAASAPSALWREAIKKVPEGTFSLPTPNL